MLLWFDTTKTKGVVLLASATEMALSFAKHLVEREEKQDHGEQRGQKETQVHLDCADHLVYQVYVESRETWGQEVRLDPL